MKANEAPDKIWIDLATDLPKLSGHIDNDSVEYIRKDAFIEKAVEIAREEVIEKAIGWIEEINNNHYIIRYSDSCEPPINELTEWFKNYMKEGDKDE